MLLAGQKGRQRSTTTSGAVRSRSEVDGGFGGLTGGLEAVPRENRGPRGCSEASERIPRVRSVLRVRFERSDAKSNNPTSTNDQGVSWGSRGLLGIPVGTVV
ncbi:uncharacterized protein PGTG_05409 [Puccinia graminis f. sp. tritici CRL 75-36-700-3]|uniref:Uncharacterized protein n=1 Tax=Puccinia graminis f. sp. tritici (strain CRL 75-36-700-3 / race SCCL) TaxID=418459 RepID=E3K478_PUCGT|nr:uncharacterized protein PGTG_05409 [Puccinia graminis f. sp. tritici CRL 75-36-700-3]EFP79088.1 hypothetical protein PGTG_05409 [Puccinia graminis f. sp. tritici CRL 75-36-700-3]